MTKVTGAFRDQANALKKLSECLKLFEEINAVCCKIRTKHKTYVLKNLQTFWALLKWYTLYCTTNIKCLKFSESQTGSDGSVQIP